MIDFCRKEIHDFPIVRLLATSNPEISCQSGSHAYATIKQLLILIRKSPSSNAMAPILVPSQFPSKALSYTTQFSSLSTRSLDVGFIESPSHPRKGFFGVLVGSIASLAVLEGIFRNIMGLWNFVHPMHVRNTAIAQYEIDVEYLEYHNKEWKDKHEAAALKAANLLYNRVESCD
jgi:hypothetical protein